MTNKTSCLSQHPSMGAQELVISNFEWADYGHARMLGTSTLLLMTILNPQKINNCWPSLTVIHSHETNSIGHHQHSQSWSILNLYSPLPTSLFPKSTKPTNRNSRSQLSRYACNSHPQGWKLLVQNRLGQAKVATGRWGWLIKVVIYIYIYVFAAGWWFYVVLTMVYYSGQ